MCCPQQWGAAVTAVSLCTQVTFGVSPGCPAELLHMTHAQALQAHSYLADEDSRLPREL